MFEVLVFAPALQCCLLCRRTIMDREQHSSYEDCVRAMTGIAPPAQVHNPVRQPEVRVEMSRALPQEHGKRVARNPRLRVIKLQRRRAQRSKLLKGATLPVSTRRRFEEPTLSWAPMKKAASFSRLND